MERLFVYLTDLSSGAAYFIIFGILIACGLGFPLPEDIPLVAAGYLVWEGTLNWFGAIGITMLGVVIGDSILFFIGYNLGLNVLRQEKYQKIFPPKRVRRVRAYFRKYGDKIVFFARFVAGFRAVAFFMAGAMHMRYRRFILLDSLAAALSVPIWIVIGWGLGHFLGDEISRIMLSLKHLKNWITGVIIVVILIVIVRMVMNFKKAAKKAPPKIPTTSN